MPVNVAQNKQFFISYLIFIVSYWLQLQIISFKLKGTEDLQSCIIFSLFLSHSFHITALLTLYHYTLQRPLYLHQF